MNIDYAKPIREILIRQASERTERAQRTNNHKAKLEAAKQWMGRRYVMHKANRVQRLPEPLPEVFQWKPRVLKRAA
jgi:hypothetical protein